jgi:hypothetical protein
MAPLIGIAAYLRAILAPHIALQLMDRCRLRPSHDVEGDRPMRVAAEARRITERMCEAVELVAAIPATRD